MTHRHQQRQLHWVIAVAAVGVAVLARMALDPWLHDALPFVTLFGAVAVAVWVGGTGPGLLAAVAGYLACTYLFIQPRGILTLNTPAEWIGLAAYLLSCAIIIAFGEGMRRARARALNERELLHQRERKLTEDFFENATMGLHWVGPDGVIQRANRTELEFLGYDASEYVGRHIADFHVDKTVIDDILTRLTRGETLRDYPSQMRRRDGSIADVLIDSSVLFEDGEFIHTRCFTRDATSQRQAERDQARLAAIVNSSSDAIISMTLEGTVVSWNSAAERMFGYTAGEIVGRSIEVLIPGDRLHEEKRILSRLRGGDLVDHFDTVRVTKDNRRVDVSLTVSPVRDSGGRIIGVSKVSRDITERKASEEALAAAHHRKDEFLAILSHELRNPLAPIANMVAVMKRARNDPEATESARQTIERQLVSLVRLVDDLMDVSRITRNTLELRREPVDLGSLIHQAVETSRPHAANLGHDLRVTLPAVPVHVNADPVRLAQVFSNLLNNACKYTDPHGSITISAERDVDTAVVRVRDSGIGIPGDQLDLIFEMFTQVDPRHERTQAGLGIGLTLVRQLVAMHGGTVRAARGGAGKGSEFVVRLPALGVPPAAATTPVPPRVGRDLGRSVLIVDDNLDACESLSMLLQLAGATTRIATDGVEALAEAERFRPDIVLLDIGLPRLDGYEVARRLRAAPWSEGMIIVALTGWGQDSDRRRSREAGFSAHLVKPVDFDQLIELLDSLSVDPRLEQRA